MSRDEKTLLWLSRRLRLRFGYPLEISLGVGELARVRYMDVIHDMD